MIPEHPEPRRDNQDPELFGQTPWQTVGPFFHFGLHTAQPRGPDELEGEVIELGGRIVDGAGAPVPDALVEIWQADAEGRYAVGPGALFLGFGRAATSEEGRYLFRTVRPGRVKGPGGTLQAPHIAVGVFGRGLLKRLVTRIYFAGERSNAEDPILALVPEARRATLLAHPIPGGWSFDIVLQGDHETVFFDI
jgi:protocatechuate 3,4-dioxygenase alpha subunit